MRSHQLLGVTDQGNGRLVSWAVCFRDGCFYYTLEWEAWLIWERSEVLGGLHGGCNEWVRSLCGGSEWWLGSAMPSWRMAGWLWRMAEASRESLRWWRWGREERGSGEGEGMEKRGRSCWEGELSRLLFFFSAASEVEWGSYCRDKREGLERARTGLGEWSDHLL